MKKNLAAKMSLFVALAINSLTYIPAHSVGMPVIDVSNLIENINTEIENVRQTAHMIEQYETQLQQYEIMLQNAAAPAAYIWDQAQDTINKLLQEQSALEEYKSRLGNLQGYLNQFQDVSYYRSSPCYSSGGCSDAERAKLEKKRILASEVQKKANDDWIRSINQHQEALKQDARTLERIQINAQSAAGQVEAAGYANQLSSQQTNQLLQLRAQLLAQQNAEAIKAQTEADRRAEQEAASAQFLGIGKTYDFGFKLKHK
ncbi:P-type conjugative transfer protein TrbJ [Bartonella sp. DGB2]|uniref:P-type conjugative transfer protein TrbJ n=1 Tax=Bartonella sp. DGB2 TaxID=3388426 RepID=UPI00398FC52C